jgi:formylglycine-generating enzyme required for sulfatase activity
MVSGKCDFSRFASLITKKGCSPHGSNRVPRGGAWYSAASSVRVSRRGSDTPSNRSLNIGFRVVLP